jgi:hypothetical protein
MQLVDLICTRVTDITLQDAVNRRMETAELMQALCGFREVASRYRLPVAQLPQALLKEEFPELGPVRIVAVRARGIRTFARVGKPSSL